MTILMLHLKEESANRRHDREEKAAERRVMTEMIGTITGRYFSEKDRKNKCKRKERKEKLRRRKKASGYKHINISSDDSSSNISDSSDRSNSEGVPHVGGGKKCSVD